MIKAIKKKKKKSLIVVFIIIFFLIIDIQCHYNGIIKLNNRISSMLSISAFLFKQKKKNFFYSLSYIDDLCVMTKKKIYENHQ